MFDVTKNRKNYVRFGFRVKRSYIVLLMTIFLFLISIVSPLLASGSTNKIITSTGQIFYSISTNSPNLTEIPGNLAPIPGTWGDYNLYGDVYYGSLQNPQLTHFDTAVTHNGYPSIRVDGPGGPGSYNYARELNNRWISVKPGDHVVFSCWIKTNPSSIGPGAACGVDLYGETGRLWEVHPRNPQSGVFADPHTGYPIYIPYGKDWTKLTLDFIIPNTLFTHDDYGQSVKPQYVVGMMPWMGASFALGESASVWFADAELYVNP